MPGAAGAGVVPARIDVVVLTALLIEEEAVVAALGECWTHRWRGRDLRVGMVGEQRVLVFPLGGMGNAGAAQAAERVIGIWNPSRLLLVGIAGGAGHETEDLHLGDVLVADQVVGYELGKITPDGLTRRYEVYRPDPDLLAIARSLPSAEWVSIPTFPPGEHRMGVVPRVHVGPMLSGDKVLADGETIAGLRLTWPKAIGVEMESLGVALTAYRNGPSFLVVKAVSDFADSQKNDAWQDYAAHAAARFAVAVLRRSTRRSPDHRPQAFRTGAPSTFPGWVKVYVCQRLVVDWEDVADHFDVPPHAKSRFRAGNQPRDLWEWLEVRGKLYELPAVLDDVGRKDLGDELRAAAAE